MRPSDKDGVHQASRRPSSHDPADVAHSTDNGGDEPGRKSRASLSNKRVSFGGTNVSFYYKEREYANETTTAMPQPKSLRSSIRPSPNPPPLPPRLHALGAQNQMESVSEPRYSFESLGDSDDASPTPSARLKISDIPSVTESVSPDDLQNTDVINDVNIFHEEDIIMNGGLRRISNIAGDAADTTLEMPAWFSPSRRDSRADTTDEGDVTQEILSMEAYFKIDDLESSKPKLTPVSLSGQNKIPEVSCSSASATLASEPSHPDSSKNNTVPICTGDMTDASSIDDLPSLAELAQNSYTDASNDNQDSRALNENHSRQIYSKRGPAATISDGTGKDLHHPSIGGNETNQRLQTNTFETMQKFDSLDGGEDEDPGEDSCINLSMTGEMMGNLIKRRESDVFRADDASRKNSVRTSTYGASVDQLIEDDDNGVDGKSNAGQFHNKCSLSDGSKNAATKEKSSEEALTKGALAVPVPAHQPLGDENWRDFYSSHISDVRDGVESDKSPTQRVLLDDVPDGEDVTLHLHPIGDTSKHGDNDKCDDSDDGNNFQEVGPALDDVAKDALSSSTASPVKVAEDDQMVVDNETSNDEIELREKGTKSQTNNSPALLRKLHANTPPVTDDDHVSYQGRGDKTENGSHISGTNVSPFSNRAGTHSDDVSSEMSLGPITSIDHSNNADANDGIPSISDLIDADTGGGPMPIIESSGDAPRFSGTPILGKRKQTSHVSDPLALLPAPKRLAIKENEVAEAPLISSSRPPLPNSLHRGGIVELSSDNHRDIASNIFRNLTPISTPLTGSAARREAITSSTAQNLAARTNREGREENRMALDRLTIEKFKHGLHVCNIEFNRGAISTRGASLLPSPSCNSEANRFEKSSLEGQVLDGVRKSVVIPLLKEQIRRLREELADTLEEANELEKRVVMEKPQIFQKLCDINIEDSESTKYSLHLKRLKKVCLSRARLSWVRDRMSWEKQLGDRLANVGVELANDTNILLQNCASIEQVCADDDGEVRAVIRKMPKGKDILRATVVQEISRMRNAIGNVRTLKEEEAELKSLLEDADRENEALAKDIRVLTGYAEADTEVKIRKLLIEKKEFNEIIAGMSGIVPIKIIPKLIIVNVGRHVQVSFNVHEDKVINISCKPIELESRGNHFKKYMEAVTNFADVISGIRRLKYVRNIGQALYRMSAYVVKAREMFDDVDALLRRRLGQIDEVRTVVGDPFVVEVGATIECSCTRRLCRFDVSAVGRTFVREDGFVSQSVELTKLLRICGTDPSEEIIVEAMRKGSTKIPGLVSLAGAFVGILSVLN